MLSQLGYRVVQSCQLMVEGEPQEVVRCWQERYFSRPWRPLQRTRTYTPMIPDPNMYRCGNKIVMHPETFKVLMKKRSDGGIL